MAKSNASVGLRLNQRSASRYACGSEAAGACCAAVGALLQALEREEGNFRTVELRRLCHDVCDLSPHCWLSHSTAWTRSTVLPISRRLQRPGWLPWPQLERRLAHRSSSSRISSRAALASSEREGDLRGCCLSSHNKLCNCIAEL